MRRLDGRHTFRKVQFRCRNKWPERLRIHDALLLTERMKSLLVHISLKR